MRLWWRLKTWLLDIEMNPLCNHFNLGMWHDERNIIECLLSERESWDPPIWVKRLLMCKIKPLCSTYILYASLSLTVFVLKQPTMTYERHGGIYEFLCESWELKTGSHFLFLPLPQISHTMGFSPMSLDTGRMPGISLWSPLPNTGRVPHHTNPTLPPKSLQLIIIST